MSSFHICYHDQTSGSFFLCNRAEGFCKYGLSKTPPCAGCRFAVELTPDVLEDLVPPDQEGDTGA